MNTKLITLALGLVLGVASNIHAADAPVQVTVQNFNRAETDLYFGRGVKEGGFGKFHHLRDMAPIDNQTVVRMNRDTIYSSAVFDLDAGPVTVTLPDAGKRFMSMQVINEDHYVVEVVYGPGRFEYTKAKVGTRYVFMAIRTLANPADAADLKSAHTLQDAIQSQQASAGRFEVPNWDPASQKKIRDALDTLGSAQGGIGGNMFGRKDEVDPIMHLIGTAVGWGGNPRSAAIYQGASPAQNDGRTPYKLVVKAVPVDAFWSISVYDKKGFFAKNPENAYSVNNLTAKKDADGSVMIQFGGTPDGKSNYLPITPGWNYTVRLYRPRPEILDGTWKFPEAQPVK